MRSVTLEKEVEEEVAGRESYSNLKTVARWLAIIGSALGAFAALFAVVYTYSTDPTSFASLLKTQVRAVIGIPMAAVSSFCAVMVLEANSGPIEFEALGFKFRGASGPVVLWIFGFLAFVSAIRILWE